MLGMTPAEIDAEVEKAKAELDREEADQRRALAQSVLYLIRENERLQAELHAFHHPAPADLGL